MHLNSFHRCGESILDDGSRMPRPDPRPEERCRVHEGRDGFPNRMPYTMGDTFRGHPCTKGLRIAPSVREVWRCRSCNPITER